MEFVTFTQPHWEALTAETRNALPLLSQLPFIRRFYSAKGANP